MNNHRTTAFCLILIALLLPGAAFAQQSYPGAALFSYQCISNGIQFNYQGSPVLQVTLTQIAQPLSVAIAIRQNQPIAFSGAVGLWALQSNELQIHLNDNPDGTKLVLASGICGAIPITTIPDGGTAQAFAFAQSNGGQAFAFAGVNAAGQAVAIAGATGNGQAAAFAQSGGPGSSGRTYVVQAGDTLYRIARRFGTTVSVLVSINGISNPNLIHPGQVIYLP
jgi:LysM repeat protein